MKSSRSQRRKRHTPQTPNIHMRETTHTRSQQTNFRLCLTNKGNRHYQSRHNPHPPENRQSSSKNTSKTENNGTSMFATSNKNPGYTLVKTAQRFPQIRHHLSCALADNLTGQGIKGFVQKFQKEKLKRSHNPQRS